MCADHCFRHDSRMLTFLSSKVEEKNMYRAIALRHVHCSAHPYRSEWHTAVRIIPELMASFVLLPRADREQLTALNLSLEGQGSQLSSQRAPRGPKIAMGRPEAVSRELHTTHYILRTIYYALCTTHYILRYTLLRAICYLLGLAEKSAQAKS